MQNQVGENRTRKVDPNGCSIPYGSIIKLMEFARGLDGHLPTGGKKFALCITSPIKLAGMALHDAQQPIWLNQNKRRFCSIIIFKNDDTVLYGLLERRSSRTKNNFSEH